MTQRAIASLFVATLLIADYVSAQEPTETRCLPIAERTGHLGCWIVIDDPIGALPERPYWHIDKYPSRAAADAAKGPGGTVVESLQQVWLFTIAEADWRSRSGDHVADIGPLPVREGTRYSAMYMEAVFRPGMESRTHTHSGPEAWYTVAGETCLETPDGVLVGRAGGPPVIVAQGAPMHLTASGTTERRALVLILHDQSQPATTVTHEWAPKGLCRRQ